MHADINYWRYWLLVVGSSGYIFGRKFKNNTVKYFGKNRKKNQLTKFRVRIFSLTHFLKCIYSICRCSRLYNPIVVLILEINFVQHMCNNLSLKI